MFYILVHIPEDSGYICTSVHSLTHMSPCVIYDCENEIIQLNMLVCI